MRPLNLGKFANTGSHFDYHYICLLMQMFAYTNILKNLQQHLHTHRNKNEQLAHSHMHSRTRAHTHTHNEQCVRVYGCHVFSTRWGLTPPVRLVLTLWCQDHSSLWTCDPSVILSFTDLQTHTDTHTQLKITFSQYNVPGWKWNFRYEDWG